MDYIQAGLVIEYESRVLDLVENPLSKSRVGEEGQRFGYDALDRLLEVASGASVEEAFAYDTLGSWEVENRQHDLANRLLEDATRTFDYDSDGNLVSIEEDGRRLLTPMMHWVAWCRW